MYYKVVLQMPFHRVFIVPSLGSAVLLPYLR